MIPYFQWLQWHLGPASINVWGAMVALGILVGLLVAAQSARMRGLNVERVVDLAFWVILAAMIGSRIFYVASEFQYFATAPIDMLKVWQGGMSISGGFIGAFLAAWVYLRHHGLPFLKYADATIFGLPIGLFIGRLGCFFIFDHPGKPTTFFLGETYIDGIVRHNHGLYLSLDGFVLSVIFFLLWKWKPQRTPGVYSAFFLIWDGTVRFFLDFLRATDLPESDARFFGFTGAQYVALLMVVGGCGIWYAMNHTRFTNARAHVQDYTHGKTAKKKTSSKEKKPEQAD